jgi:hypothetical protein
MFSGSHVITFSLIRSWAASWAVQVTGRLETYPLVPKWCELLHKPLTWTSQEHMDTNVYVPKHTFNKAENPKCASLSLQLRRTAGAISGNRLLGEAYQGIRPQACDCFLTVQTSGTIHSFLQAQMTCPPPQAEPAKSIGLHAQFNLYSSQMETYPGFGPGSHSPWQWLDELLLFGLPCPHSPPILDSTWLWLTEKSRELHSSCRTCYTPTALAKISETLGSLSAWGEDPLLCGHQWADPRDKAIKIWQKQANI